MTMANSLTATSLVGSLADLRSMLSRVQATEVNEMMTWAGSVSEHNSWLKFTKILEYDYDQLYIMIKCSHHDHT